MKKIILLFFIIFSMLHPLYANKDKQVLKFGYFLPSLNDIDSKDIKISLDFWAQEISKNSNLGLKSYFYKDINKMKKDVENKKLDVVTASLLVLAKDFEKDTFQDGFNAVGRDPKSQNTLLLLVPKNSSIKTVKDLKHKRIIRSQSNDMEQLFFNTQLQKLFHLDADEFFKKTIYVKNYAKAVLKLFFKKADAALVTQEAYELAAELNPQIKKRLKILKSYNVNLKNAALFRKDIPKHIIDTFLNNALTLHKSARGKQILMVFRADHIVQQKVTRLEEARKLYKTYIKLKE